MTHKYLSRAKWVAEVVLLFFFIIPDAVLFHYTIPDPISLLLPYYLFTSVRSDQRCSIPTLSELELPKSLFSALTQFIIVYPSLWVMKYFHPTAPFWQAKRCSPITIQSLFSRQLFRRAIFFSCISLDLLSSNTLCHVHRHQIILIPFVFHW